jgi:hypothetical protein
MPKAKHYLKQTGKQFHAQQALNIWKRFEDKYK